VPQLKVFKLISCHNLSKGGTAGFEPAAGCRSNF
jgi:hypothetical protein